MAKSGEDYANPIKLSLTTTGNILGDKGILPAHVRAGSIGWWIKMSHFREQLLAADLLETFQSHWERLEENEAASHELAKLIAERVYVRDKQVLAITLG